MTVCKLMPNNSSLGVPSGSPPVTLFVLVLVHGVVFIYVPGSHSGGLFLKNYL